MVKRISRIAATLLPYSINIYESVEEILANMGNMTKQYWTNIAPILGDFSKSYEKSCRNITTIIPENVSETFLQYFVNFTDSSGKFRATFIKIFHESFLLRYLKHYTKFNRLFCKVSRNIQISVTKFLYQYFHNRAEIFPTIITWKDSDTFPKYFVYGLDTGPRHFTKCSGKFRATFIEIFQASFL